MKTKLPLKFTICTIVFFSGIMVAVCANPHRNTELPHLKETQKKQSPTKTDNWWMPDTVTMHSNMYGNISRTIYAYDDEGRIVAKEIPRLDYEDVWQNRSRTLYTYDKENLLLEEEQYYRDELWITNARYVWEYDANNNALSKTYQVENNGEWRDDSLYAWTYDERGNKLTEECFSVGWDGERSLKKWHIYTYDRNNNMLTEKCSGAESGILRLYTWTYDERNNKLTEEYSNSYSYNDEGPWLKHRYFYTYDENNNMLTDTYMEYYAEMWDTVSKNTYIYDTEGNKISQIYKRGNAPSRKLDWTYDDYGKQVYVTQLWGNNQWENETRIITNMLEEDVKLIQTIQLWEDEQWVDDRVFTDLYDKYGNTTLAQCQQWENGILVDLDNEMLYYYNNDQSKETVYNHFKIEISYKSKYPVSITSLQKETSSFIYPNPVKETLYIQSEAPVRQILVYDIYGKIIKQEKNTSSININNLAKGVYLVKLTTEKGESIHKVIKE